METIKSSHHKVLWLPCQTENTGLGGTRPDAHKDVRTSFRLVLFVTITHIRAKGRAPEHSKPNLWLWNKEWTWWRPLS